MDIDFASNPELAWILGIVLWLFSGVFLDILKLIFSTFGGLTTGLAGSINSLSKGGRLKIDLTKTKPIELNFISDVVRFFSLIKCALIAWSQNFLSQVVKAENEIQNEDEISEENKIEVKQPLESAQSEDDNLRKDSCLVPCANNIRSVFSSHPRNKYAGQQVIGALLGFSALLIFIYADAAQGAQTFDVLFKEGVPPFLNSIVIPLIVASAGSAVILGVFIGDMYGFTHLGFFKKNPPLVFKVLIPANLTLSLLLSTFISLARQGLLDTTIAVVSPLVNIAQSLAILPMLITTALLFQGISGIFVVLAILLASLAAPFGVFEFFMCVLQSLLKAGVIGGTFIIGKILWLVLGAVEKVFLLLQFALKGSFSVLIYLVVAVFVIPNLLFRAVLKKFGIDKAYEKTFEEITRQHINPDKMIFNIDADPENISANNNDDNAEGS